MHRGIGCADERFPGVYSRISYVYDWIVETGCQLSEAPPDYFNCNGVEGSTLLTVTGDVAEDKTEAPTFAPSEFPSTAPSSSPTANNKLDFVAWTPPLPLRHCEGDCDRDTDCAGGMICYQRYRGSSMEVPGCEDDSSNVPAIADFCIFPSDDPN
jgi:hypothetical protein